jgi:hypothetical protein
MRKTNENKTKQNNSIEKGGGGGIKDHQMKRFLKKKEVKFGIRHFRNNYITQSQQYISNKISKRAN